MNIPENIRTETAIRARWEFLKDDRVGTTTVRDILLSGNRQFAVHDTISDSADTHIHYIAIRVFGRKCIVGRYCETFVIVEVV